MLKDLALWQNQDLSKPYQHQPKSPISHVSTVERRSSFLNPTFLVMANLPESGRSPPCAVSPQSCPGTRKEATGHVFNPPNPPPQSPWVGNSEKTEVRRDMCGPSGWTSKRCAPGTILPFHICHTSALLTRVRQSCPAQAAIS